MAKKLLITGFDPFGGDTVNPSWEAVRLLPDIVGMYEITKMEIPTVFGTGAQCVLNKASEINPDVIICVGQAGGRPAVTPEVIGINLREARIADNAGNQPVNVPINADGPAAYFATIPAREIVKSINDAGIPSSLSYSAGAFVCNDVMYTILDHYELSDSTCFFSEYNSTTGSFKKTVYSVTVFALCEVNSFSDIIYNKSCAFWCNNPNDTLTAVSSYNSYNATVKITHRVVDTHNVSTLDGVFSCLVVFNNAIIKLVFEAETTVIRVHRRGNTYFDEST